MPAERSEPPDNRIEGGPAAPRAQIRLRGVLAVLIAVPAATWFFVWRNWRSGGTYPLDSLIGPAVAALAILLGLNAAVRRWKPKWSLSSAEVITVYFVIALVAGLMASPWGWGGSLAAAIVYPVGRADPGNNWQNLVWPNLPPHLTVMDRGALQGFFLGGSDPYSPRVLAAWLTPALWWIAWVTGLVWVFFFGGLLVRRRWSEEEKLPFPMTLLPLRLTDSREGIFGNPLWWAGIGVSVFIGVLAILNSFLPSVPTIPTGASIAPFLTNNPPWDAIRVPDLTWSPWYIGLAFLMPVDIAFSLIVFNLLWRVEYVGSRMGGWLIGSPWAGFPYGDQQCIGGFLALTAVVLWLDRRYLVQVLRKAAGFPSSLDDRGEAFSYRTSVLAIVLGVAFLYWFLVRGGMSWGLAGAFLTLTFVMAHAILRMRAQFGPPAHDMAEQMPWAVLTTFPGLRAIGPRGLTMLALQFPFMYQQNAHPAPTQLEALTLAGRGRIEARRLGLILLAVVPLAMVMYFWANLHVGYSYGLGAKANSGLEWVAQDTTGGRLDSWLREPGPPNWGGTRAMGIGFGITVLLMIVKLRFPMWPLHPIAFPLAFNWTIDSAIPAVIATWLLKIYLLKYGGLRAYRRALPFFLGLLVGSAVVSLVGAIVSPVESIG